MQGSRLKAERESVKRRRRARRVHGRGSTVGKGSGGRAGDAGGVPVGDAVVGGRVSATVGELGGFDVGLGVGLDDGAGTGRPVDEGVGRGVVGRGVDLGVSSADVRAIAAVPSSPTVPFSTSYRIRQ